MHQTRSTKIISTPILTIIRPNFPYVYLHIQLSTHSMWAICRSWRMPWCSWRGVGLVSARRRGGHRWSVISSIIRLLWEWEIGRVILAIPLGWSPRLRDLWPWHTCPQTCWRTRLSPILIPPIRWGPDHRIWWRGRWWNALPQTPPLLRPTGKHRSGLRTHVKHFWFRLD